MKAKEQILQLLDALISEGKIVLSKKWEKNGNYLSGAPQFVDLALFRKWQASCHLLVHLLGSCADPWRATFDENLGNSLETAISMQERLKAIRDAIQNNLLMRYEDLILSEAFSDLIEQAEYLLKQGYALAAGVILRAVLEEHLRRMCNKHECSPSKSKPTINDYNMELYKLKVYDKVTMKHVEAMVAIGNAAAHNSDEFKAQDISRFNRDIVPFLQSSSV